MAEQSRLEREGIQYRHETVIKNDRYNYIEDGKVYSYEHKDAISDGDALGKGANVGGVGYLTLEEAQKNGSKHGYKSTVNTSSDLQAGGKYDIEGTEGVEMAFQGKSGRNFLKMINKYNESKAYGLNSVDTTINKQDGQFYVK